MIQLNQLNLIFIGDTCSGKTTLINTVIREYYEDPQMDMNNTNILKINNLKEQGINYFRNEVKTFCQTCSTIKGKKKILVLDDIDSINEQIQQIFRYYIDKYNTNIHFICSCNNTQNIIENLQSRLTIIKITPLQKEHLLRIIHKILQREAIRIDEAQEQEILHFILSVSNHNIKIIMNYLEKFKLLDEVITLDICQNICTNINFTIFEEYVRLLAANNLTDAIRLIYSLYDKGYSNIDILDSFFLFVKHTRLIDEDVKYRIIPIICKYIAIFYNMIEEKTENALLTNELIKVFPHTAAEQAI
jgi:DNA polymerase III delta prime subunit